MIREPMLIAALAAVLVAGSVSPRASIQPVRERPCRENPLVNGPCFTLHGRMNYYNGTPSVRIWRVGTTRILGISDSAYRRQGYDNLPPDIAARLSWNTDLFADFVVCPFENDKPGHMRLVCVDSASHILVRPQKVPKR